MFKRIALISIVALMLVPAVSSAYRFGVGGYTDLFSHGLEFCFWTNLGERSQWFIGPHGFGVYYFAVDEEDSKANGFYTLGLRTGIMWMTDEWISPTIGASAGYTRNLSSRSESENYGARLFSGLSFAPFDPLSEKVSWLSWFRPVSGLRFTFETGVKYHYNYYRHEDARWNDVIKDDVIYIETDESAEFVIPDFGFGLSFNW
ncbi:hypothetical protein GF359_05780 [candidate division WOR-3 bacterium]|uniref:Uncharacterized protein n=1 Tax=candidate division WOR-3 bacterium TaxID=2052148 RepID=A0A9D5QD39_UNCW3|nr:hypothetical protein [candidate division WOR-3 bacterium]MBD3364707.1 hypothetical protein [candidate division WOR-3 bacterium]